MSLPSPAVLHGRRIGLSVSPSPDLRRLALPGDAVETALEGLVEAVLTAGGTLAYGGHLNPGGHADVILPAVRRLGAGPQPALRVYLAWTEHQDLDDRQLAERLAAGPYTQVLCLDPAGKVIPDPEATRAAVPPDEPDPDVTHDALTAMRRTMAEETDCRVLVGGRRSGFSGAMPGLAEEALCTVRAGTPLYLAAGLGGVTADIARAFGVDACDWLPPDDGPDAPGGPGDARPNPWREALAAQRTSAGRAGVPNGLTDGENRQLAAARSPQEIADLVVRGTARLTSP